MESAAVRLHLPRVMVVATDRHPLPQR